MILKKLPDVVGFYMPGDRSQDCDGTVLDPKTGEYVYQPTMTKQEFIAESDINNIVRDFTPRVMAELTLRTLQAGGFDELPDNLDYQQALEIAGSAQNTFATLPAQVRKRFDNDPGKFLQFMQDPANQDEAIKLGLATDTRPIVEKAPEKAPEAPLEAK